MSSILSQRDKDLVSNYLLGGAAAGGGLALATALVNYLKHLKDEQDESEDDDDTIKIYKQAPQEKVAMTLGGPLAITGGLVSAAGTYALVNKLYEALRKKQAQDKLDEAQNIFLETQGYKKVDKQKNKKEEKKEETEKSASGKAMSASELGVSIPLALPLIMALGSGVVAHKLLNKSFPVKSREPQAPKRIEIVDAPQPEEEEKEKESLLDKEAGITDADGFEFLLRTIHMTKAASSDVSNLIATAADGRLKDFRKVANVLGFADALDTVKGAAKSIYADPLTEQLAISCLAKSASVGEQTKLLAAAEFADMYPTFFKTASQLSEKKKNALYKIACILGHAIRSEIAEASGVTPGILTKKADVGSALFESMLDMPTDDEIESNDSTETSQEETGIKKKKKSKFVYSSKRGFRLAKKLQDDDVIDKILSPGN
jgi:hypothetical protein